MQMQHAYSQNCTERWKCKILHQPFQNFLELFQKLHDFVEPLVKRKFKGVSRVSTKVCRKFARSPKKFGPKRKLDSKDELLLTLMTEI